MQREDRKLNRNTVHNPSNDNDEMEFDPEFLRQQRLVTAVFHELLCLLYRNSYYQSMKKL